MPGGYHQLAPRLLAPASLGRAGAGHGDFAVSGSTMHISSARGWHAQAVLSCDAVSPACRPVSVRACIPSYLEVIIVVCWPARKCDINTTYKCVGVCYVLPEGMHTCTAQACTWPVNCSVATESRVQSKSKLCRHRLHMQANTAI